MFESLSKSLQSVVRRLSGRGALTEGDVDEALREVRTALLGADVAFKVAKEFCARVRSKAVGVEVLRAVQPGQQVIKIVHDELVALMGEKHRGIAPSGGGRPVVILVAGLQGSGKTTTCAKLARLLIKKGRRPLLVAADLQRPAAIDQLETLGRQIDCPVHVERGGRAPMVCRRGVEQAKETGRDVVILDTAGRLHVDRELMDEVKEVAAKTSPDEVFLVCDAMTGQDAVVSAKAFDEALPLTGVILTKLDGDARGGAALTVREVTGKPIRFAGTGEKLENLEEFDPARMAGRILGMGDVVALVELAQEHMDREKSEAAMEKAFSGTFTLDDFLDQMTMVEKMGGLTSLLSKLPGAGGIGEEMEKAGFNEKMLVHKKAIVLSMTPEERAEPELMDGSRRRRIAKGCGRPVEEVNRMLKEFRDARTMMEKLGNAQGGALGRMFGGRREKRKGEQFRNLRKRGWSLRPGKPGEQGRQKGS
ncbi:MAG: signal recognition particle protein [Planctomycetaceae bacterium]|nr:signal recognition particle protein [Planctomycetota bacterium]NUN52086.1 signal recognition particle protein [Planctomycetaceae bacterium]